MAKALLASYRRFGYDGIGPGVDVTVEGEALGSAVEQPEDGTAFVVRPVIQSHEDLDRLAVPDPRTAGRMPVVIEATEICAREAGEEACICSWTMGPFNCASQARGVEPLMFDLVEAPDFVHRLLDFCTDVTLSYGRALIDAGARWISLGEAICSPNFISPAMYREFVVPRQRTLIRGLLDHGAEAVVLHVCGRVTPILDDLVSTGATILDIDWPVDMATVTARIPARGNLDPSALLLLGSVDQVAAESRRVIETAGPNLGLILGSGCDVSPDTPAENIDAMVRAAREYGTYPLRAARSTAAT
jgi:uroporphyrinogen decarboxylase